jgi:hypothetical protein
MGKQLNFYRSAALLNELEADAARLSRATGRPHTPQDVLRIAYRAWRERQAPAKKGAKR